ncbi:MAG: hypothetical protein R2838_03855 [Caldilineaceae bacterium]
MPSNRSLTILGFVGYLLIGTAAVLMPSVMPLLTQEYTATGLSLAAVGFVFPAMAIGGILGNLLSGVGSDVAGRTRSVWLAALALAGACRLRWPDRGCSFWSHSSPWVRPRADSPPASTRSSPT